MSKRERPPMPPLSVRVQVAERQFAVMFPRAVGDDGVYNYLKREWSLTRRLQWLLGRIFEDGENTIPHALDHDPALILRHYNQHAKDVAARYNPHAHNPDFLVYRSKEDHQQKTTGRKPGAERTITTKGSDIGLKTKFARLERPKRKSRFSSPPSRAKKSTWPKRPFPKRKKTDG